MPILNSRTPVRLWPRVRPINRHIVERSLRIAAFGPHTCRPFPVRITTPREEVTPAGH
jgi:hypothetical protein